MLVKRHWSNDDGQTMTVNSAYWSNLVAEGEGELGVAARVVPLEPAHPVPAHHDPLPVSERESRGRERESE